MTREEAFADLKRTMSKETEDIVYRCKDCIKYNLCNYYYRRKETSQICHYFELTERKTGKWIDENGKQVYVDEDGFVTDDSCACSECGAWLVASDEYLCRGRYCPNCGAKMEVDE